MALCQENGINYEENINNNRCVGCFAGCLQRALKRTANLTDADTADIDTAAVGVTDICGWAVAKPYAGRDVNSGAGAYTDAVCETE